MRASKRPDTLVGISHHVAERIRRHYGREASVVYPPVDLDRFTPGSGERSHLLVVSALVPYKAIELATEAVRGRDVKLVIVGDGLFPGSIGRTDLMGGSFPVLEQSIRSQLYSLPDETRVICGHGPDTTIGHERASNPFVSG